jgi:hypothetical protein
MPVREDVSLGHPDGEAKKREGEKEGEKENDEGKGGR